MYVAVVVVAVARCRGRSWLQQYYSSPVLCSSLGFALWVLKSGVGVRRQYIIYFFHDHGGYTAVPLPYDSGAFVVGCRMLFLVSLQPQQQEGGICTRCGGGTAVSVNRRRCIAK